MPATSKDYVILNNSLQIFSPKSIKSRTEILRNLLRRATQNLITVLLSISQMNASRSGQSSLFGKICGEPHVFYHEITVNSIVSFLLSNKTACDLQSCSFESPLTFCTMLLADSTSYQYN